MQIERSLEQFINPEESLVDILSRVKPQFNTLHQLNPSLLTLFPHLSQFFQTTLVSPISDPSISSLSIATTQFQTDFAQMLNMNISYLLSTRKSTFVQTQGRVLIGKKLKVQSFCQTYKLLKNSKFKDIYYPSHTHFIKTLLYKYTIIIKQGDNYVQVTGPPIYEFLNYSKSQTMVSKKNGKKVQELLCNDLSMKSYQITRRLIFYHSSLNRVPGLWKHNPYFVRKILKKEGEGEEKQVENLVMNLMVNEIKIMGLLGQEEKGKAKRVLIEHFERVRRLCRTNLLKNRIGKKKQGTCLGMMLKKYCDLPDNYQQLKKDVEQYHQKQPEQIQQIYNKLYQSCTKVQDVQELFQKIITITIPDQLFGPTNKNVLKRVVKEWIAMNRFEDYRIDDIMLRIDLEEIKWFSATTDKNLRSMRWRKKRVIAWIICFLFKDLFVGLLAANFYVTEKHRENNRIFFYRKQIWMLVSRLSITKFESNNLKEIGEIKMKTLKFHRDYDKQLSNSILPCGKLRILPKKGTFRPIITFNSKNTISGKKSPQTLNQYLFIIKIILRGLKKILGSSLGYSVFDNFQIFDKYLQFYKRWKLKNKPKVCYFSLDIEKCYDSIDPVRLSKMIEKSDLIKEYYVIYKYVKIFRNKKPVFLNDNIVSCFNAKERITSQSIQENLFKIDEPEKSCIYIYTGQTMSITKEEIVSKLTEVCQSLVVVYKNKRYRQTFGIPQGLNISGVLCSLYFAMIQSSVIINDGLLMRLTDDYIFLGEEDEARRVLDEIMALPTENSFKFNEAKIKSNFQSKYIKTHKLSSQMEWIGKTFNLDTLQYFLTEESDKQKLKFSMNVNYHQASKPQLYNKKFTFITLRNHLKNKLKSLLTNQFIFYFKPELFQYNNLILQIKIFVKMSLYKFQPFIEGLKRFELDKEHKLVYSVYREAFEAFAKFACSLFPKNQFNKEIFNTVYRLTVGILIEYCANERRKVFRPYTKTIENRFKDLAEKLNKESFFSQQLFNQHIKPI